MVFVAFVLRERYNIRDAGLSEKTCVCDTRAERKILEGLLRSCFTHTCFLSLEKCMFQFCLVASFRTGIPSPWLFPGVFLKFSCPERARRESVLEQDSFVR